MAELDTAKLHTRLPFVTVEGDVTTPRTAQPQAQPQVQIGALQAQYSLQRM